MTKSKDTTAMTSVGNAPPPVYLAGLPPDELGHGLPETAAGYLTPQAIVLQALSPQVSKHDPAYLEHAEPGDIAVPVLGKLYKGEVGVEAVLCAQRRSFSEFLPGRGGFVGSYDEPPNNVEKRLSENGRQTILVCRDSENVIEPTVNLYLLLAGEPVVMYASRSKLFFARQWSTACAQYKHPVAGKSFPSYARCWQLKTALIKRALGSWFTLAFDDLGWTPKDLFERARDFNRLAEAGGLRLSQPMADMT
jgi:hypothetical protein